MFFEYERSVGARYLHVGGDPGECFSFPLHMHKSFEAIFVFEGEITVQIGQRRFAVRKGECALVFPGEPHAYITEKYNRVSICIFSADYLPELSGGHHPVFPMELSFLGELRSAQDDYFRVKSLLYSLASRYARGEVDDTPPPKNIDLLCAVVKYIEKNFP